MSIKRYLITIKRTNYYFNVTLLRFIVIFISIINIKIFMEDISKFALKGQFTEELILVLLREELKSYRFFGVLRTIGLDDAYFQTDLSDTILKFVGLNDETNHTLDLYFNLLEKHSQIIEANNESVMKEAQEFYSELIEEHKKRFTTTTALLSGCAM